MKVGKTSLCMMINPYQYQKKHVVKNLFFQRSIKRWVGQGVPVSTLPETNSSHLNPLAFCKMNGLLLKARFAPAGASRCEVLVVGSVYIHLYLLIFWNSSV